MPSLSVKAATPQLLYSWQKNRVPVAVRLTIASRSFSDDINAGKVSSIEDIKHANGLDAHPYLRIGKSFEASFDNLGDEALSACASLTNALS